MSRASDYRYEAAAVLARRKPKSWGPLLRASLPLVLLLTAGALGLAIHDLQDYASSPYPAAPTLAYRAGMALPQAATEALALDEVPVEYQFSRGETLSGALGGLGFDSQQAHVVATEVARFIDVRQLRPLDRYAVVLDNDSRMSGVDVTIVGKGKVAVRKGAQGVWVGTWAPVVKTIEIQSVRGELTSFLEDSLEQAGGKPQLAYLMADVFQWDLDFNRDLRTGDRFEVLYEAVFLDGEYFKLGDILAVSYENLGRRLEAYRYGDPTGYYDAEGRPLRKMFLRSPLRYSRVTSRFSSKRFHPILKRYRPHYGVDYGAPTGTPVRVTANGVVTFAGRDGGGGKTVKVRHPNGYMTAYLHLSGFAKGISSGRRVGQGDTVGFVGSTGLATASHLDYRIQHHGKWINPLSLKSVPAEPVAEKEIPDFLAIRDQYRALLQPALEQQLARHPEIATQQPVETRGR